MGHVLRFAIQQMGMWLWATPQGQPRRVWTDLRPIHLAVGLSLGLGCGHHMALAESLRIRKDQHDLSAAERVAFTSAIWEMKNTPVQGAGANDPQNIYDAFTELHRMSMVEAHENASFLPWHREFLWQFENELLAAHERLQSCTANTVQVNCTPAAPFLTGLPYWDWTRDQGTNTGPWTDDFMGGNGAVGTHVVTTGPFASSTGWSVWDPENLNGGPDLKRGFGATMSVNGLFPNLPPWADVSAAMQVTGYDVAPYNTTSDPSLSFRNRLEGWLPVVPTLHNLVHVWIDGTMFEAKISPGDPVFFLHHAYVDRIWWDWQQEHGIGPENYQPVTGGTLGQNLHDTMANVDVTPADMLDIQGPELGYLYAPRIPEKGTPRDIVIALDVSTSMYDQAGFANLTKLDAAADAVELLASLIEPNVGHRVGLVEFSERAEVQQPLGASLNVTPGAIPFDHWRRRGATSLTDALTTAQNMFPPKTEGTNAQTILLLTDGQHTAATPFQAPALSSTQLNVIGFGSEAQVNAPLLAELATDTGGIFYRAQNGLDTKKALIASFGEAFASGGVGIDPYFQFAPGSGSVEPLAFGINDEREVTVVVAWENAQAIGEIELLGPGGVRIVASPQGVTSPPSSGSVQSVWSDTYATLRLPLQSLPQSGQGGWQVRTHRTPTATTAGGLTYPDTPETFFVTTLVEGGAVLRSTGRSLVYTGDEVTPNVTLYDQQGRAVPAEVELFLTQQGMDPMSLVLLDMGQPSDGGRADGVYGSNLGHLTQPGSHEFMVRARYGNAEHPSVRETMWSTFVEVGIDADVSPLEMVGEEMLENGWLRSTFVITPQDAFGNKLGADKAEGLSLDVPDGRHSTARLGKFEASNVPGTYHFQVDWDPHEGLPDLLLLQPQRAGERFVTPGSLVGKPEDDVVDVILNPHDGMLDLHLGDINTTEILIESALGIFGEHAMPTMLPEGYSLEISPHSVRLKTPGAGGGMPHGGGMGTGHNAGMSGNMGGMAMDMGPHPADLLSMGGDMGEMGHGDWENLLSLGTGFLSSTYMGMLSEFDLRRDLTIKVARGEKVTHFVTLRAATVAGDLVVVPEPTSGLAWLCVAIGYVRRRLRQSPHAM